MNSTPTPAPTPTPTIHATHNHGKHAIGTVCASEPPPPHTHCHRHSHSRTHWHARSLGQSHTGSRTKAQTLCPCTVRYSFHNPKLSPVATGASPPCRPSGTAEVHPLPAATAVAAAYAGCSAAAGRTVGVERVGAEVVAVAHVLGAAVTSAGLALAATGLLIAASMPLLRARISQGSPSHPGALVRTCFGRRSSLSARVRHALVPYMCMHLSLSLSLLSVSVCVQVCTYAYIYEWGRSCSTGLQQGGKEENNNTNILHNMYSLTGPQQGGQRRDPRTALLQPCARLFCFLKAHSSKVSAVAEYVHNVHVCVYIYVYVCAYFYVYRSMSMPMSISMSVSVSISIGLCPCLRLC